MSLILHCGARAIDRSELELLPDPVATGPRHQPVHHADFVRSVESSLHDHGYEMVDAAFGVSQDHSQLFGVTRVEHQDLVAFDGGAFTVGFRGSTNQTLSQGLSAGTNVFVCDNLSFMGDVVFKTKSTTFVRGRLPTLIEDFVMRLGTYFDRARTQAHAYQATQVSYRVADSTIVEMGRQGIINWSELGKVVSEWDEPQHEEHVEGGRNIWRLFNAATETLKPRNPEHPRLPHLASKTVKLHRICDQLAELPLAA